MLERGLKRGELFGASSFDKEYGCRKSVPLSTSNV
jgi:hypothetical protein